MDCAWAQLLAVLPPSVRAEVDRQGRETLQEIRLRRDLPTVLEKSDGKIRLSHTATRSDLEYVVNMACRYSPWTAASMAQGFITVSGGHRIGLCGQALVRERKMSGLSTLTSVNIRVARDFAGIGAPLGAYRGSMLLLGPPGSGKTTLLRDLVRQRSARENVSVVDERGEIFPPAANFYPGVGTDVLSGCGKEEGIETVLRTMTPACIAVDEITAQSDCTALIRAGKCGVQILATAHAKSVADLCGRPIYAQLLNSKLFDTAVVLRSDKSWRTERITV